MLFLSFLASEAAAQQYPSKPVRFVVPYPPGGPLDTVARLTAQKVSEAVKQPVIIDNKPGAGGNIGADIVAKSPADGYTILMGAVATHAINPTLYASIPYDPVRDFAPVTQLASTPNILIVNPSIPASNVREFIAYAKANPGKLNFGSGSTGSAGHLAGELFKSMAGIEMTHVPYKGAAPAMQDLVGGQIQLMFDNLASALGQVRAGKVKGLAVTTAKRTPLAPACRASTSAPGSASSFPRERRARWSIACTRSSRGRSRRLMCARKS
jgi:tripartite-type tricarboxylate transporter receptor subunit TctC